MLLLVFGFTFCVVIASLSAVTLIFTFCWLCDALLHHDDEIVYRGKIFGFNLLVLVIFVPFTAALGYVVAVS